jgi:hypothetical protein
MGFNLGFKGLISTVAVMQQTAQTMLWYAKFKSTVCVNYEFKYKCGVI